MFRFKQFTILQDRSAMKVGTDGILLGAWVRLSAFGESPKILDIGTGTGLLALMLAQRSSDKKMADRVGADFEIDAIELDTAAAEQAAENVKNSAWCNHIKVECTAIQHFIPVKKYDIIISNPPYFVASLGAKTNERHTARHTDSLSYDDFLAAAKRLLTPTGSLFLILPYKEAQLFLAKAEKMGLDCTLKTTVFGRNTKPPERCLLELQFRAFIIKNNLQYTENELIIYAEGNTYTADYKALTEAFYL
jgi:tRNA1Val (adenine37-N6)-methyltransferase